MMDDAGIRYNRPDLPVLSHLLADQFTTLEGTGSVIVEKWRDGL